MSALDGLAARCGIQHTSKLRLLEQRDIESRPMERRLLDLGPRRGIPDGYHHLQLQRSDHECLLVATPGRCWLAPLDDDERLWGLSVSLFTVRSGHNWGTGDFSDLRELATLTTRHGGAIDVFAEALGRPTRKHLQHAGV